MPIRKFVLSPSYCRQCLVKVIGFGKKSEFSYDEKKESEERCQTRLVQEKIDSLFNDTIRYRCGTTSFVHYASYNGRR